MDVNMISLQKKQLRGDMITISNFWRIVTQKRERTYSLLSKGHNQNQWVKTTRKRFQARHHRGFRVWAPREHVVTWKNEFFVTEIFRLRLNICQRYSVGSSTKQGLDLIIFSVNLYSIIHCVNIIASPGRSRMWRVIAKLNYAITDSSTVVTTVWLEDCVTWNLVHWFQQNFVLYRYHWWINFPVGIKTIVGS